MVLWTWRSLLTVFPETFKGGGVRVLGAKVTFKDFSVPS